MHLPPFNEFGFLPPRDYEFTDLERKQSSLVLPGQWQSDKGDGNLRARLIENLAIMVEQLWKVSITVLPPFILMALLSRRRITRMILMVISSVSSPTWPQAH